MGSQGDHSKHKSHDQTWDWTTMVRGKEWTTGRKEEEASEARKTKAQTRAMAGQRTSE